MSYVPHTQAERRAMLDAIGVDSLEALFEPIPARVRDSALDLPRPGSAASYRVRG